MYKTINEAILSDDTLMSLAEDHGLPATRCNNGTDTYVEWQLPYLHNGVVSFDRFKMQGYTLRMALALLGY